MKHEKIQEALEEIHPQHISEAASYRKKNPLRWISPVAAMLAVAILVGAFWRPLQKTPPTTDPTVTQPTDFTPPQNFQGTLTPVALPQIQSPALLSSPQYPQMAPYATGEGYSAWVDSQRSIHYHDLGYADSLRDYFSKISATVLKEQNGNAVFSPLNIYMALAMLAETADGESRRQILTLLGAEDLDALRKQAEQVWRTHYYNDGLATSMLGSSLWLDENCVFNASAVEALSRYYYASVFQGDLSSKAMEETLHRWLNANTGDLLSDQVAGISFPPEAIFSLATTLYYQVQWQDGFHEASNITAPFHAPTGDTQATYMRTTDLYGPYYWGEDFGAVSLGLRDGSRMWLILPDEGKSPQDLLQSGHAMDMVLGSDYSQKKSMIVNISVPKFDISSDLKLKEALMTLGITDVFGKDADLSAILPEEEGAYVSDIQHAARLMMDEEGVTASAYTVIMVAGAAMPPTEEIDFTLDRPFLFVIESSDGLPLFAGTVVTP